MQQMDKFLGSKPNIASSHAVNISTLHGSKSSHSFNIGQMPSTSSFGAALSIPGTSAEVDMVQDERESVSAPAVTPQNSEAIIENSEDITSEPPAQEHIQTQPVTEYLKEKTQYLKDKRTELQFNRQYKQRRLKLEERKVKALEALAEQKVQLQ